MGEERTGGEWEAAADVMLCSGKEGGCMFALLFEVWGV